MVIENKDYDSKLENQGWKKMESLLNEEKPKTVFPLFRLLPYAATLLIGAFSGFLLWQSNPNPSNEYVEVNRYRTFPITGFQFNYADIDIDELEPSTSGFLTQELSASSSNINIQEVSLPLSLSNTKFVDKDFSSQPPATTKRNLPAYSLSDFAFSFSRQNESEEQAILRSIDQMNTEFLGELDKKVIENPTKQQEIDLGVVAPKKKPSRGIYIPTGIGQSALVNNKKPIMTTGSLGLVSSGFDKYGVKMGLEFNKPITNKLSVASGVRYSKYKQKYQDTYDVSAVPSIITERPIINELGNRSVDRNFVEVPLYLDFQVNEVAKLKAGVSVTYNNNDSSRPTMSENSIVNSPNVDAATKFFAPGYFNDQQGYLGEAVIGATLNVDKISFDAEILKGLISNQDIDNRSVVGVRLSYTFGSN